MRMDDIPFGTIDWDSVEKTEHKGDTGVAYWRTRSFGDPKNPIRVRSEAREGPASLAPLPAAPFTRKVHWMGWPFPPGDGIDRIASLGIWEPERVEPALRAGARTYLSTRQEAS